MSVIILVMTPFVLWPNCIAVGYIGRKNYVTSAEEKKNLLETDRQLIILLNSYAMELQDRINVLRGIAKQFKKPLEEARGREEEYLLNPLNRLALLRQMHEDWEPVKKFMRQPVGQAQIESIVSMHKELPMQEDLNEANHAMFRIIQAYGLEPKDVARGLVDGVQYRGILSASNCYAMGMFSFKAGNYQVAAKWLSVAKDLLEEQPRKYHEVIGVTNMDITLLLARSLVAGGNLSIALDVLMEDSMLRETGKALSLHFIRTSPRPTINVEPWESAGTFNDLCRSASRGQSNETKPTRLHCRYNTTTSPFLQLAPLRVEELSLDPFIMLYHNVLSNSEIETLEQMSGPFLERSKVFLGDNGTERIAPSRSADGVWLPHLETKPDGLKLLSRIERRIGDITGLNMRTGGKMQFLKYGFGGHFVPHHDYFDSRTGFSEMAGDRIATVLFYLNNVEHGGATAFPKINLAVPTQKGSALFWHNLDGETYDYDKRTFHGACPLISGVNNDPLDLRVGSDVPFARCASSSQS
ncbi:prolyl 4-hydroxylase subunit alpha-2 isoform X2 [Drosophila biarmipes]|uniref:prolyl 4-hydroxylase subunit alpha-2 isoform X2 n=1 Tax=Drosophila biarmipes TaxID=125945 RepID=UPI0007E7B55F|nr:prolyl 4-hydroxylase subunit alpha-2 isoform X2 [Drosophila biarmipes]